jgi:hypothetical protein
MLTARAGCTWVPRRSRPSEWEAITLEANYDVCRKSFTMGVQRDSPTGGPFCVWRIRFLSDGSDGFFCYTGGRHDGTKRRRLTSAFPSLRGERNL